MPGTLKMKYVRLAVGDAKDEYWSDLPETIFGQKFSSARNHMNMKSQAFYEGKGTHLKL